MRREVRRQLINFKIPERDRATLPVFCSGEDIFLVHGLPLADGFKPKNGDRTVYIVCARDLSAKNS